MLKYFSSESISNCVEIQKIQDLLNKANKNYDDRKFSQANSQFQELQELLELRNLSSHENILLRSRMFAGLGKVNYALGNYQQSVDSYRNLLSLEDAIADHSNASIICPLIGQQETIIFCANYKQSLIIEKIPQGQRDILSDLNMMLDKIRNAPIDKDKEELNQSEIEIKEYSKKLYNALIKPVEVYLKKYLIILLEGIVRYIPFSMLFNEENDKYLVENYIIESILSTGLEPINDRLPEINYQLRDTLILAMGAPITPNNPSDKVESELNSIVKVSKNDVGEFYGLSPLFDEDFIRKKIYRFLLFGTKKDLRKIPERTPRLRISNFILHIVTHGEFKPEDPESSFLELGDGSQLSVANIIRSNQLSKILSKFNLVVLSACETARGNLSENYNGEEIPIAINTCFLQQGVRTVIASLWQHNYRRTSDLMKYFYKILRKERISVPEALQRAQLSLKRQKRFSHPFYWAAFIVTSRKF